MFFSPAMPPAPATPETAVTSSARTPDAAAAALFSLFPSLNASAQQPAPPAPDAQGADEPVLADAALAQWIMALIPPDTQETPQASDKSAAPVTATAAAALPLATAEPEALPVAPLLAVLDQEGAMPELPVKSGEAPSSPAHAAGPGAPAMNFQNFENWLGKVEAPQAPAAPEPMNAPAGTPRWDEEFGQQVVWAARQGLGSAEIHLHPQELGRVSVSLQMDKDQASVSFTAAQVHAGTAIEQALPRLRELFAHEGLNLAQVQVQVSTQMNQQQRQNGGTPSAGHGATASGAAEPEPLVTPAATVRRSGLLDDYA